MKTDFDDCICLIESEKIRNFVKQALELAPPEFWKAPCSSTGKHHPPEDNLEGGIIIHSRKAVLVALELFKFFDIKDRLTQDKIIAAVILHDIQKNGRPWSSSTDFKHGMIACAWLMKIASLISKPLDQDLFEICLLVKNHMGIWSEPLPKPAFQNGEVVTNWSINHLIVQLADYWASQKWCPFVCDELDKEK